MAQLIIFLLGLSIILLVRNTKKEVLYRDIESQYYNGEYRGRIFKATPYLIRYTIFKCKYFSIKIHKCLISDPDNLHDHPWNYVSIILWGGYWEVTPKKVSVMSEFETPHKTWYGPLSILKRRGDKLHKLIIPEGKYNVSLIFVGRRYRGWGYHRDENVDTEWNILYEGKPAASKEIKQTLRELSKKETSWLIH